ncbi:MAG TPA: glycoside hydrolase family 20 zincin-like fold domain-containing protein [Flavisolibacter sp.]|jgi:hypothetical protein|nr:glycoside hydrolase family 20 zincin-like fold domain-containing protein [Flavisolibacter sp.]
MMLGNHFRKQFLSFLFLLVFLQVVHAAGPVDPSKQFRFLPTPQKVEWRQGRGLPANALRFITLKGGAQRPILTGSLETLRTGNESAMGTLVLAISNNIPFTSAEGYLLEIKDGRAIITAKGQAGLFYGCQTLTQLLEDAREQSIEVPSCRITDYPEMAYRAVHLDLKHHLDAGHYYYNMIDRLAKVKVNAIIVEFEDKLRFRKAPAVGASNAISIEEFAAITRYAKDRNIEISPLVQGLGHASFILKHEQYKKLRDNPESDWAFDPLNPETYDLQFALYEDAMAATPGGRYLHVGGDEVGKLGMSELAKKSGKQPFELQMFWLNKVADFAQKHNRIPIFWDDMLFKLAGVYETTYDEKIPAEKVDSIWRKNEQQLNEKIDLFPKNCVYMRWNYWDPTIPGNKKAIDWYKSHGLNVMAATAAQTNWPMMPRENSNLKSMQQFCRVAIEKNMDGILCTVWDDASPHHETIWRGLYNFAALSWNDAARAANEANAVFLHRFYGSALNDSTFEFQNKLENALFFWEAALLEKGHRYNYPENIQLIDLPDAAKPGSWNQKYSKKIAKAKEELKRYQEIRQTIGKAQQVATRNQYSLSLMNAINELQIYPAQILLQLSAYDEATSAQAKKEKKTQVLQLVSRFVERRKQYEDVFSATRFLSNPPDYVMDQNGHHHLANGTLNSDWMYVYELAMNKKISEWESGKSL